MDDCVIIGTRQDVDKLKKLLSSIFKMKDLGKLCKIIGIEVERTEEYTKIHQAAYIRELIERFRMGDAKEMETPALVNNAIDTSPDFKSIELYQSLVGSLLYLSTKTRPDIAYAVHEVTRKMNKPTDNDWQAAKRILRYLKGTQDVGLVYQVNGSGKLVGFADASYASQREDRKSVGSYTYLLNGAAITWSAKKQATQALSSCEAELLALTEAAREGRSLQKLQREFGIEQVILINEDNQSAKNIAENGVLSERTKHIQTRFHFIKDEGKLIISYCSTQQMTADVLTKALSRVLHQRHCKGLGLDVQ